MAHIPINHPLRPFYRALSGLCGVFILAFGIMGAIASAGEEFFSRADIWALWLKTNMAFSLLSIVLGAILVAGYVIGGDISHWINYYGSWVLLAGGLAGMAVMQTELNVMNWSMVNVIVSLVFGTLILTAGLYDKAGPRESADAEEAFRHNRAAPAKG
ncbi:DUF4383 domain-containing protein [Catenuloplanes atrovinosus]|uniref:Membrane protein n=1 Tax=Catenuloplanes atrovinosus TaxID=137266 RepID=A0AAE4CGG3_9ACTN|nr:DUF4383 domain-containing protein [Catenuloplanes atrovinosus]MDR7280665.1 putative membrane protein [Catenuloplanes atrovinosus]